MERCRDGEVGRYGVTPGRLTSDTPMPEAVKDSDPGSFGHRAGKLASPPHTSKYRTGEDAIYLDL